MADLMEQKEYEKKISEQIGYLKQMILNKIYLLLDNEWGMERKAEILNSFIDALIKLDNIQLANEETDLDVNKVVKTMLNKTLSRKNLI